MSFLRNTAFCPPHSWQEITLQERAYRLSIKPLSRVHKAFPVLRKRLFRNTGNHIYLHNMCNTLVCKTLCIYVKKARIRGNIAGRLPPHDSQRLDVIRIFLSVTPYHTSARCFSCSVLTILSYPHSQCQPHPAARYATCTTSI